MKYVFLGSVAVLSLLSGVAWWWEPERPPGKTVLTWCTDDSPTRREQLALFNRLNPDYELRLDPQNSQMEKVIVQSLAGVGPDLFDSYSAFHLVTFVRSGIAWDITEELAKRGISPEETWRSAWPSFVHEGRVYGFPGNAHAPAIWYNKRLFDEAGIPYPQEGWTWEECIAIAKRLTVRDARGRLKQAGFITGWDEYLPILSQWNAHFYTPEGTRCTLDSPEAQAAAAFMQDMIYKRRVVPSPGETAGMASSGGWGSEFAGTLALFGAERGAMAMGGRWWLNLLRGDTYKHLRLGAVGMPKGPSEDLVGYGRATLINVRSRNREAALRFIECLHSREWNDLMNRQADAMAAVKKYNYTDEFLHDPEHPEEDYNEVWREALEKSVPMEMSPYVQGQVVDRLFIRQLDLLRINAKPGPQAMIDVAGQVNKAIVDTLRRDPVLREQYMKALAAGARPAWDRPEDAP